MTKENFTILGTINEYTILRRDTEHNAFICAYNFDYTDYTWAQGHYFRNFQNACTYAINGNTKMSFYRLEEIATYALNWINDNNEIISFDENYGIDLTNEEYKYFGLMED